MQQCKPFLLMWSLVYLFTDGEILLRTSRTSQLSTRGALRLCRAPLKTGRIPGIIDRKSISASWSWEVTRRLLISETGRHSPKFCACHGSRSCCSLRVSLTSPDEGWRHHGVTASLLCDIMFYKKRLTLWPTSPSSTRFDIIILSAGFRGQFESLVIQSVQYVSNPAYIIFISSSSFFYGMEW